MENLLQKLLRCILNYCVQNDIIFWYEQKNNFYRLYLGSNKHYKDYQSYTENPNGLINDKFIRETPLSLDFKTNNISATLNWLKGTTNNPPEKTHKLAFHCLQNTDNQFFYSHCFNNFFADPKIEINFIDILKYADFKNNSYEWADFFKQLSNTHLNALLDNPHQLEKISSYLNENYDAKQKENFIEPFLKYYQLETVNSSSINFANFINSIFSDQYLEKYACIPALQKIQKNNDFFKNNDDEIIEKVVANYNLFNSSSYKKLNIQKLIEILLEVTNIFNKDVTLKTHGLLNLECLFNPKELTFSFYLSTQKKSQFNKNDLKNLLKNTINIYSNFLDNNDKDDLNYIITKSISEWCLNKNLIIKSSAHKSLKI